MRGTFKIFKKLPSMVTIRISGSNCEKFMNLCTGQNIVLKSIKYDNYTVLCSVRSSDFIHIRQIVKKTGVHIDVLQKSGFARYIGLRKKRYGFLIGALIFGVLFCYLTSHVWAIDISGTQNVKSSDITDALKKSGIYIGCFKYGHDYKKIKNEILLNVEGLAWAWVEIDGTKANVKVRENKKVIKKENKNGVYNIVASYGGYITQIMAKSGQRVVQSGDAVNEGDLLISGVSATAYKGNRYIHSNGVVMANTYRKKNGEYHHTKTDRYLTEKCVKKTKVRIFNKEFKLYADRKPKFKLYEKATKVTQIKIFENFYLPVIFTTDTFCEIIEKNTQISDAQVVATAVNRLTEEIEYMRDPMSQTIKKEYEYKKLKNGNLRVTVCIESNENIAKPIKVQYEKSEE